MVVLVVVAGPQASGKSTVAPALGEALRGRGERVAVVELDALAAMALPTLPSWDVAHEVFEAVVGLWARSGLTCVIAEGSGHAAEVERLLRQVPPGGVALTVAVTTSVETAYGRAQADPTRGVSKDRAFLQRVYEHWPSELELLRPDVLLDTDHLDVAQCVTAVVQEVERRRGRSS